MKKNIHRPLPPHLTLYMSQLTSTFPISHRISGAFLATMVLFSPFLCPKMGLISLTYENFYQSSPNSSKFIPSSVGLTAFALSFHLYHGVRHLFLDFGHLLLDVRKKFMAWFLLFFGMPLREQSEWTKIQPNIMIFSLHLNGYLLSSINSSLHRSPDPILKGETINFLQMTIVNQLDTLFQQRGIIVPDNWTTYKILKKVVVNDERLFRDTYFLFGLINDLALC